MLESCRQLSLFLDRMRASRHGAESNRAADADPKLYEQSKREDGKSVGHGREGIDLRSEVIHSIQCLQEASQRQRPLPSMRQRRGRPDSVFDLPTICPKIMSWPARQCRRERRGHENGRGC